MKSINKKGFTLAELLVVVAIIAVLVVVSIPIFTAKLAKTRETTCIANRTALKHHISADYLSGDLDEDTALDKTLLNTYIDKDNNSDNMCPSGGTYYFVDGSSLSGGFKIRCTYHDDNKDGAGNEITADSIGKALAAFIKETGTFNKDNYDSTSNTENVKAIKDFFKKQNITLGKADMTTWAYKKASSTMKYSKFYWTSVDISKVEEGKTVPVMCYNFDTKTYTVRQIIVTKHSEQENPTSYNILENDGSLDTEFKNEYPNNDNNGQTYDNAYGYYKKALEKYK